LEPNLRYFAQPNRKNLPQRLQTLWLVDITRDGWVAARILPDLLGIRAPATILVAFYVNVAETKKEPVLTQGVSADVTGKNRFWLMT